ncbi:AfsA-related hotdog domain-containing protein [Kitasatospora mediocidica]|uniref:AfsA-related hotdog domain-containing protein n=1 Tax=Kitasatospora mediocidica TaxID=58352 RepID=UPI00055F6719|nr:AfsA-related hotdog domain-containing protein [Kitasatospora mediocidica]
MSTPQTLWVVGESFSRATVHPHLVTARQLREQLAAGPFPPDHAPIVIPGLGIDEHTWAELREAVTKAGARLADGPHRDTPRPVARHRVLKHAQDNVLIGDAHAADGRFRARLSVANDTEMIRDHTADQQHVPGMLLIEACTQLVTWAVGELVGTPAGQGPRYAVMHGLDLDFAKFVFPLPTDLDGTLTATGPPEEQRVPLEGVVTVRQAGRICSTCRVRLHAFDPTHIFAIEHAQAIRTLERAGSPASAEQETR